MELMEALRTRRSIGRVLDKEVPKELIEKIIEAATWAPNHFKTEPWRFFVLTGDGRKRLGETLARIAERDMDDPTTDENQAKLERARNNPFRAPLVIVAAVEPSDDPRVILKEEYAAVNAGIQNMLLAAHSLGLGAVWRTGKPCYDQEMSQSFGLSDKGEVVGFIYIGYPDLEPPARNRKSIDEVTTWISTD
ncbi:nitroreductase family protein [Robertmurraya andreesenii]|uniref:Putative NAD(P)H nitroreductase n=1 Tax=Anoxybacillus andreesenii TaxID=1325932 RepID=A0ABT9V9G6_9BACL|nr:nitroreductase [Robertmurraya andreesenii]MDQ0157562.1 nitroreductase [Robertmurraya andreesenii]